MISAILLQANPITQQGAIDAGYVMTGTFIIIGFLLVFIAGYIGKQFISALNTIKEELKDHSKKHEIHSEKHTRLETEVLILKEAHNRKHAEQTAALILNELKIKSSKDNGFRNQ